MSEQPEFEVSVADRAVLMAYLEATKRAFGVGIVHLPIEQRQSLHAMLAADYPLEMRLQMLPTVHIRCMLVTPDAEPRELFSLDVPDASPIDPRVLQ
jgi:hypothetical protein